MSLTVNNFYVYQFYLKCGGKKATKIDVVRQLLAPPHLIIKLECQNQIEKEQYQSAVNVCKNRLATLITKVQKHKWFDTDSDSKEQTFFNLSNYPDLVKEGPDSLELLGSQSSTVSTHSELEELHPDPPVNRKTFDDYKPRTKRAKTDDIYHDLLERAKIEGFDEE